MRAIDLIGQGHTQTRACDMAGLTVQTFRKYIKTAPELQDIFDDAEQRGHDTLADVLLDIENHHVYGSTDPKVMRVMSDNIKWFLARKRPSQYGDRLMVDHKVTLDRVIVDALQRGMERAGNIIEGEYRVLPPPQPGANLIDLDTVPAELRDLV